MTGRFAASRDDTSWAHPTQTLHRLQARLVIAFGLIAAVAITGFGTVLVVRDIATTRAGHEAGLRAAATRASALMYLDGGEPETKLVMADPVSSGDAKLVIVGTDGAAPRVLLDTAPTSTPGIAATSEFQELVRRAQLDRSPSGSFGFLPANGSELHAAAIPWWGGDHLAGVVVAVERSGGGHGSALVAPTVLGGIVLLILLSLTVWWTTSVSVAPAVVAARDRERFLAAAAHELKTPLARLRAGAESIGRSLPPDSPEAGEARRLVQDVDSASSVVTNLLLAARIDNTAVVAARAPVRLDQLASDLEMRYPLLVADVREPLTVLGDAALLRHALINLLDNAVRHGRGDQPQAPVMLEVARAGDEAVVEVRDHGPGFPRGRDIGQAYVTTGHPGGTGLGLPIVRWVVERHGGRVELLDAHPGAVVRLRLPLMAAPDPEAGSPR